MIVLDTHAWIWWVSGAQELSREAATAIDRHVESGSIRISAISVFEVTQLVSRGRLQLTMAVGDWIARSEALPFLDFIPVDNRIAVRSAELPGELHRDPADRIIVATALGLGATLITKDERLRDYPHVETLW